MNNTFKKAADFLEKDGVIAFKTDTVMGLGVNGSSKEALKKLFDLKNRSYDKPVALLTYAVSEIFEYAVVFEKAFSIIKSKFPGAITCILNSKRKVYTTPEEKGKTIGVRIPKAIELLEFLSYLPFPVVATSANLSGKNPLRSKEDIYKFFPESAVYYVDFGYNIKMSGVASTVVDCTGTDIKILREGSIKV